MNRLSLGALNTVGAPNSPTFYSGSSDPHGLTLYRDASADVVLTDILMPERDGLEVTRALTQEFLDARVIVIIGATGDRNDLNVPNWLEHAV